MNKIITKEEMTAMLKDTVEGSREFSYLLEEFIRQHEGQYNMAKIYVALMGSTRIMKRILAKRGRDYTNMLQAIIETDYP